MLRRAGATPTASRRCGVVTRREAERLVKSFVEDSQPPRLPADFVFNVRHSCGWGCVGSFMPCRYNSSRAKCIKCGYCNDFFSPNKFLFHFHHSPDATYRHPDAANFKSWRRHLSLDHEQPPEALVHVWEDVKATFNCGKRNGLGASYSAHAGGCSAPEVQQQERSSAVYPAFAPFKSYPINTSHIPYATAPLSNVLLPPTTPSQSGNMWLDHQAAGIHPFSVLLNRHLYSSMIQRHAYGMPLLGLHNSAYASVEPMPSFAQQPDLVAVASPHSAFRSVSAQKRKHDHGIGRDSSCVAPQAKLAHVTERPGKVRGKMVDDRYPEKN